MSEIKVRYRIEYDEDPSAALFLEDTPEKYKDNEVIEDGEPLSFDAYMEKYGRPELYVVFGLIREESCGECDSWNVTGSVWGLSYLLTDDYPGPGTYSEIGEKDTYMAEIAADLDAEAHPTNLNDLLEPDISTDLHSAPRHWKLSNNGLEVRVEDNLAARAYGLYKYGSTKANMRLIAAAPDLLYALRAARRGNFDMADEAIAKAGGQV